MVPALALAKHGSPHHAGMLDQVRNGETLLCFAIQEQNGAWNAEAIRMSGRVDGETVVLNGTKMLSIISRSPSAAWSPSARRAAVLG